MSTPAPIAEVAGLDLAYKQGGRWVRVLHEIAQQLLAARFAKIQRRALFVARNDAPPHREPATPIAHGIADTGRLDLCPEAAGLLAVSLGLSRMYGDDLEQLEAGMPVYDAFYRWCRDAVDETHDWVSHTPKARVKA